MIGLDASLLHLQQIWKSMPFSGILAIGQGASVASLLPPSDSMQLVSSTPSGCTNNSSSSSMDFGIFVHGEALMEDEEALMAHWPCLHVVAEHKVTNPTVQRLVQQFPGQIHVSTSTSTTPSTSSGTDDTPPTSTTTTSTTTTTFLSKSELNAIGQFLVQQKKELLRQDDDDDNNVLVLQTQLHLVEQEANRIMALEIADNPPKALMAIIQPSSSRNHDSNHNSNHNSTTPVAGCWQGPKRNLPSGGAPCPSEFILKRDKRSSSSNNNNNNDAAGPSRHHPSTTKQQQQDETTTTNTFEETTTTTTTDET